MGKMHDRFKAARAFQALERQNQKRQAELDRLRTVRLRDVDLKVDGKTIGRAKSVSFQVQPPRKGFKDELCNRTACQKPGAYYLNTGTNAYYCLACACQIRPWALPDFDLFPDLKPDEREPDRVMHFWNKRRATVRVLMMDGMPLYAAERRASQLFQEP